MSEPTSNEYHDEIHFEPSFEEDEDEWQDAEDTLEEAKKEQKKIEINETDLRKKIVQIQLDKTLTAKEKAKQIQGLMSQGLHKNKASLQEPENNEYEKTYSDKEKGILGCQHYQRKCKLQANCCQKLVTCRFCHDDTEDHQIVRNETKNMFCMICSTVQPAAKTCQKCNEDMARYYCDKCKFWDDHPERLIYHCDDCGICRKGKGLGQDFFHCKKCNVCLSINMEEHKCIERNLESDCPICGEYMFTSTSTVIFMPCGHSIHNHCRDEYIQTSYQCPTCLKSLGNMTAYFDRLDKDLQRQPMPAEYAKFISHIFCNDCEKKSSAKYHFFYHKCSHCSSFNTTVLKTENTEEKTSNSDQPSILTPSVSATAISHSSTDDLVSSNSDQDYMMQNQLGSGNTYLGMNYIRNPAPGGSSSSSSTLRNGNGTESNDG